MNLQPYDYTLKGIQDPGDSFMAGMKQTFDIQGMQAAREEAKLKQAQALRAQAQQEAMNAEMADLADNPTVEGIRSFVVRNPSFAKNYDPILSSLTAEKKANYIKRAGAVFAALNNGRPDLAISELGTQIEAARNSGKEEEARHLELQKKMLESRSTGQAGNNIVNLSDGLFLAIADPDNFAKNYGGIVTTQAEQAEAPAKLSKAQADALLAKKQAEYGPNKQTMNTSDGIYERQSDGSWLNTGKMPFAQPGVTVNYGAGQAGVSKETGEPIVYQLDQKTGKVRVVEGVAPTGHMTEAQSAALGFGLRAIDSNKILNNLEKESLGDINTYVEKAKAAVPFIGNALTKSKFQEYEQAKLNFITAVLRKESGAAIGKDEFAKEDRKYFPQPGDSPAVIKQKKNARSTQIMVLQEQAGRPLAKKVKGGYEREVDESKPTELRTVSVDY